MLSFPVSRKHILKYTLSPTKVNQILKDTIGKTIDETSVVIYTVACL